MRLPSEEEWMRAARGQTMNPYPWGLDKPGESPSPRGNFGEKVSTGDPEFSIVPADRIWTEDKYPILAPPCSFPQGNSHFGL